MAWDPTKPPAGGPRLSSEIRQGWEALERSLYGINLILDPLHIIWAAESADGAASQTNPPTHYYLTGTGATSRRCGTGLTDTNTFGLGGYANLVTYGSALANYGQTLFPTLPTAWRGKDVSAAVWIKTSSASAARLRINDGVGSTYSPYHTGGGAWEGPESSTPLIVTRTLDASATTLKVDVELSSGSAYVEGMMACLGPIPPRYFIPAQVAYGMLYFPFTGTVSVTTKKGVWAPARPGIIKHCQLRAETAPATQALKVDVNTWDGSAFTTAFTTKPEIAASGNQGGASPDGAYARRCLNGLAGSTLEAGKLLSYDVDQVGTGTPGSDLITEVRIMQFVDPLEPWKAV